MPTSPNDQIKELIERIVRSQSRKKLIVAGPGTGKTTLFKTLLKESRGDAKSRLVLTFINNLKADLENSLSDSASVFTLHGYCQLLLHRQEALREGLTEQFKCLPGLATLIAEDWKILNKGDSPQFVGMMRNLDVGRETAFYLERANYYDAVDFDDSVFRVQQKLAEKPDTLKTYDLVLIDEYQDFNRLEAGLIDQLASCSPIVIAGDDDQALYSQLRGSSWDFIRSLHQGEEYEKFILPFCMRCPEVIVGAVNDIMQTASEAKKLAGRIKKDYLHFEPVKGKDSKQYPSIEMVTTSVQRKNANYFGRYIDEAIANIPKEEFKQAAEKGEPAVLLIGARQYLQQVIEYLSKRGHVIATKADAAARLEKEAAFELLDENPNSNLGWRIILHLNDENTRVTLLRNAFEKGALLVEILPNDLKESVLSDVKKWREAQAAKPETEEKKQAVEAPSIKAVSFEGSKGMSAQHVFIVGVHEDEIPRDAGDIKDIEICRFVVGLTRAKKKCYVLCTNHFGDKERKPSIFLKWVKKGRFNPLYVDANYWNKGQ